MDERIDGRGTWTFLTNHARVLAHISRNPGARIRDIAAGCLLTERAVQKIIGDLESGGYLSHTRHGRTNHYRVIPGTPLRHPADQGTVDDLLAIVGSGLGRAEEPARPGH